MSTPILATKLYVPPPPPKLVPRAHLIERLNVGLGHPQGFGRKLTLISAPAGFGKSTLVSEWVAGCGWPVAWLSLDAADQALTRFLTGLIAAVQTLAPQFGAALLGMLQSPQAPPTESILTALVNEIAGLPKPFLLVLDDYHALDSKPVDEALTFLIEHLPPRMHLVMATREDPHVPLARLRVRGQLTELRVTDLRFTPAEAAEFLNQAMGLAISDADVAALESRTEGWIAGLQLAALALQGTTALPGHPDTHRFIQSFTGSHRFVLDYLVEEVLMRQPEPIQHFLLRTSILERLCGPLCEAVALAPDNSPAPIRSGQDILEYLEHANLFMIPLDQERRWYRYHHLFAELLRQRLHQQLQHKHPLELNSATTINEAELHLRASLWFEREGWPADAIRHAFAAKDFERAANLIEREWPAMHRSYFRSATTLGWMQALPVDLIRMRPVLSVGYAWELLNAGELEVAAIWLRDAEQWLQPQADSDAQAPRPVVVDKEEFQALPASIATAWAYLTLAQGDVAGTVTHARRALDLYPAEDPVGRGPAAALLGLAYWASGDLVAAYRTLADGMANFQMAGNIQFAISGTYGLADILIAQGRLREAIQLYERNLQLALAQGGPTLQGTADLYLGLSELSRERGDLDAAAMYLSRSEALGEAAALPNWPFRLCLAQARMKQIEGDLDGALTLLDKAERLYVREPVPEVRPIAALKARLWVVQGQLAQALSWVRERHLSIEDDLGYLREFEHITLARVLLAEYKHSGASEVIQAVEAFLGRLLQAAEAGGRTGSVIELLILQALAREARGDLAAGLTPLERALQLAEPEAYIRMFVDEGPPMAALLGEAAKSGMALRYVSQLGAALAMADPILPVIAPPTLAFKPPDEPLSERELEVLRLLGSELSGPEMAARLHISLNTLRTHTKNIFSKLGASNRRAAVRIAQELGL